MYHDSTIVDESTTPVLVTPVRSFPISLHPVAADNTDNFDASQLRGTFTFDVLDPDYATALALAQAFGYSAKIAFDQNTVNLTAVNPQLAVTLNGTNPSNDIFQTLYAGYGFIADNRTPTTTVTLGGNSRLQSIQGKVTVHNVQFTPLDDSQSAAANILTLTNTSFTGWATPSGAHPSLSFDATLYGNLVIIGSPTDQFDVENTPSGVMQTTIQNPATSGPAVGVYLMGRSQAPFTVTGDFGLYIGRRLQADGTVDNVGQADGVFYGPAPSTNEGVPYGRIPFQPVFFNYAGVGQGQLVDDLSTRDFQQPGFLLRVHRWNWLQCDLSWKGIPQLCY